MKTLQLIQTVLTCAESKGVLLIYTSVCGAGDTILVFYVCTSSFLCASGQQGEEEKANTVQSIIPYFVFLFPSAVLGRLFSLSWMRETSTARTKICQ